MTHVIASHKVKDYETWKNAFDSFVDFRRSAGEVSYRILHPTGDPNDLTIVFEWDSLKNAETFLESAELKSAMGKGGVIDAPKVLFLEEADRGTL